MNTIQLKTRAGESIDALAKKASDIACGQGVIVEFDFNGIVCLVDSGTDPGLLYRDYMNASIMGWHTIGPDCPAEYTPDVQAELVQRKATQEAIWAQQKTEGEARDKADRELFATKTAGIDIEFVDQTGYLDWKAGNTDSYGACIFEYAESWAKLMQLAMAQGQPLVECAGPTSHDLGFLGITGYMYGAAVGVLFRHWKHGEAIREWHNGKYSHTCEGVVNPAVLTIAQS